MVVLSSIFIYWFYFSKPSPFPTNEQLVKEINSTPSELTVAVIQKTLPVDDRHAVVPFISKEDDYGLSYWVWKNHKWRVANIDTNGGPRVWKINRKDPSTFYFVWNIHHGEQISTFYLYLIRDRGYHVTKGVENYNPRVQMEKNVSLHEKSYGVMKLPVEWEKIMNSFIKVESAKQPDLFFNHFFPEQTMTFGWLPGDKISGKEIVSKGSGISRGYSNGNLDIENIGVLNKENIELPLKK